MTKTKSTAATVIETEIDENAKAHFARLQKAKQVATDFFGTGTEGGALGFLELADRLGCEPDEILSEVPEAFEDLETTRQGMDKMNFDGGYTHEGVFVSFFAAYFDDSDDDGEE